MTRPALAIVNPSAGSYDADLVADIRARLERAGPVEIAETTDADELDDALRRLDGRLLSILGGDGSVHAAVGGLDRLGLLTTTDVVIVPMGTGNDFAGGLGLPDGIDAAALLEGPLREARLDLIRTDDGIVVNAAHAGVGAVASERATRLKDALGDVAYKVGAVAAGVTAGPWDVTVTVDGEPVHPDVGDGVLLVAVANGPRVGGGTDLCPDARPDDGLLDVLVSSTTGPARRAALGAALLRGEHDERDDVVVRRGREVVVSGVAIPWNLDGELPGERAERRFTIEPGALRLLLPGSG